MFAPQGYRHFDEFFFDFEELTAPYIQEREAEFHEFAQQYHQPDKLIYLWRNAMDTAMALLSIDHRHEANLPVRICSPQGNVVVPAFEFFISNKFDGDFFDPPDLQSSVEDM